MSRSENWAAVERFREACERDDRVVAAFLGGSLAAGTEDEHSDLDLYVIVSQESCADLVEQGSEFVSAWGNPVFTWVTPNFEGLGFDMLHFVLGDGVCGELAIGHPGNFRRTHGGPHRVLVDKCGLLEGAEFPLVTRSAKDRRAGTERALAWFWLHVIGLSRALARDRLWIAQWQINELRTCLWRLLAAAELPAAAARRHERALADSFVPLDRSELLRAAARLVETYRAIAPEAAGRHRLQVPEVLARVAEARLASTRPRAGSS